MFYLFLSIFFSVCIFFVFKSFSRFKINILPAITTNYLVAFSFGFISSFKSVGFVTYWDQPWFVMAAVTGIAFIVTFFVFAVSTQKVGVAMTVVSSKMSIVISVIVGFVLLSEPYNLIKIAGIIAALLAFYFTTRSRNDPHIEKKYLFLPFVIFLGTGANDSLMKLSGVYFENRNEIQFLTVTFFIAFLIGFTVLVLRLFRRSITIAWKDIFAGILLGLINWGSTYFFIKGLFVLPISFFIPVFNASLVVIAALAGFFFLEEKLARINWIGIVLAVISIAAIAFS